MGTCCRRFERCLGAGLALFIDIFVTCDVIFTLVAADLHSDQDHGDVGWVFNAMCGARWEAVECPI